MRRSKGTMVSRHFTAYVKSTITLSPSVMSTVRAGSVDTFTFARGLLVGQAAHTAWQTADAARKGKKSAWAGHACMLRTIATLVYAKSLGASGLAYRLAR